MLRIWNERRSGFATQLCLGGSVLWRALLVNLFFFLLESLWCSFYTTSSQYKLPLRWSIFHTLNQRWQSLFVMGCIRCDKKGLYPAIPSKENPFLKVVVFSLTRHLITWHTHYYLQRIQTLKTIAHGKNYRSRVTWDVSAVIVFHMNLLLFYTYVVGIEIMMF